MLAEIGFQGSPEENVRRLAGLAERSGLDGVVCSPQEVAVLRGDLEVDKANVLKAKAAGRNRVICAAPTAPMNRAQ